MKVARRLQPSAVSVADERYVLLAYSNGTVTDPRMCPVGNMTPSHWRRLVADVEPGRPNTECLCDTAAVA